MLEQKPKTHPCNPRVGHPAPKELGQEAEAERVRERGTRR